MEDYDATSYGHVPDWSLHSTHGLLKNANGGVSLRTRRATGLQNLHRSIREGFRLTVWFLRGAAMVRVSLGKMYTDIDRACPNFVQTRVLAHDRF